MEPSEFSETFGTPAYHCFWNPESGTAPSHPARPNPPHNHYWQRPHSILVLAEKMAKMEEQNIFMQYLTIQMLKSAAEKLVPRPITTNRASFLNKSTSVPLRLRRATLLSSRADRTKCCWMLKSTPSLCKWELPSLWENAMAARKGCASEAAEENSHAGLWRRRKRVGVQTAKWQELKLAAANIHLGDPRTRACCASEAAEENSHVDLWRGRKCVWVQTTQWQELKGAALKTHLGASSTCALPRGPRTHNNKTNKLKNIKQLNQ